MGVSPLHVRSAAAPAPAGKYWIRAVGVPTGALDWIYSPWQLVTLPIVNIDLVPDDPQDVGWVKVNDGNDAPKEIKIRRPFDDGTTGVDLVLTMPKGSHRIRLWKDATMTQPVRFNNATFANGGNRFSPADFGGNETLSLYVEGIEPSDDLHDTELMLSVAGDIYCMDVLTLTVVQLDLILDSNNDGAVTEEDNEVETVEPGHILGANCDDDGAPAGQDNLNDVVDQGNDENDMARLTIKAIRPKGLPGNVHFALEDSPYIRVFDDAATPLESGDTLPIAPDATLARRAARLAAHVSPCLMARRTLD